jgi:hypothetical protein
MEFAVFLSLWQELRGVPGLSQPTELATRARTGPAPTVDQLTESAACPRGPGRAIVGADSAPETVGPSHSNARGDFATTPMTIEFPNQPEPAYDVRSHAVIFPALVDGQPVSCLVTEECLAKRCGGGSYTVAEALRAYEEHRDDIRELAESVIRRFGANKDGVVCVNSATVT